MDMDGSRNIDASPEFVWQRLNDPMVLKQCIAGCEEIRVTGEGVFVASLNLRFGPLATSFDGRLSLSDIVNNRSYTITFEGVGGVAGYGRGTARVRLESAERGTRLIYIVETDISGKLARIGKPLVNRIARRLIDDFFSRFENVIETGNPVDG
jgi:carbon monoxide dehydrogenase subunit G